MMKRTITMLLLTFVLTLLSACGEPAEEAGSLDFRRELALSTPFCETEDTVYYTQFNGTPLLLYADKATGIGGPLCGKPECTHDNDDCNAYLGYNTDGIAIYDGKLYFRMFGYGVIGGIYRMDPDGNNRELVRQLDQKLYFALSGSGNNAWFHRGYVYSCGGMTEVENGNYQQGALVYAESLTDPDEEPTVIFREMFPGQSVIQNYQLADNSLYIILDLWDNDKTTDGLYDDHELRICRWDIETREMETVFDNHISFIPSAYWATEDSMLLTNECVVYELKLKTGELSRRFDFNEEGETFDHLYLCDNMVIGQELLGEDIYDMENQDRYIRVKDFDGRTIFTGVVEAPDIKAVEAEDARSFVSFSFYGGDAQCLYGSFFQNIFGGDRSELITYLVQIPLDGSGARIIAEYDYIR